MTDFDAARYASPFSALWSIKRIPALGPGTPNEAARPQLSALSVRSFSNAVDGEAARACISGVWLYHDFLHESHTISQDLASWFGSYWHGIMHRREPDAENAKYWFRRVIENPVFEQLSRVGSAVGYHPEGAQWDSIRFVDECESQRRSGASALAQQLQLAEMRLLFDWCYQKATGSI